MITVRYATAGPGPAEAEFVRQLGLASGGRLRARIVRYDNAATDVDVRIAKDVAAGKVDVAEVGARAWESLGVMGLRAFQSPFLLTSQAALNDATADPRVVDPLLRSLAPLHVTGLAVLPVAPRYLFSIKRPLQAPRDFAGARIRINASPVTADILRSLGARPTTAVRSGRDVVAALRSARLDAVEADIETALTSGYVSVAPYIGSPIFGKATTLVANAPSLRTLGPEATRWLHLAARRTAAALRNGDTRTRWVAACGAGLQPSRSTPPQLDALHVAERDTHTLLDGDSATALAIDRIGMLAVRRPAIDTWARCGHTALPPSPTEVIDGSYEMTATVGDLERVGATPGNEGYYRVVVNHGRYALIHHGPPDFVWPGWDFSRDPVEVGEVVLSHGVALFRPETSIRAGSIPGWFRFELFRGLLRLRTVKGDGVFGMHPSWRKIA